MQSAGLPNGHPWNDDWSMPGHMCALGISAHAGQDPVTGAFTGQLGCNAMMPFEHNYHVVYNIDPEEPSKRKLLAKVELPKGRQTSVMHSMGYTSDHIVLIANPFYTDSSAALLGKAMCEGMLKISEDENTTFQVINRKDGSVRTYDAPAFIGLHVVNSFEDEGDVVVDLSWYSADNEYMPYKIFYFKNLADKEYRDNMWPNPVLKRYRLKSNGKIEESFLLDEHDETSLELPKVNARVQGQKYCIFYAMQQHAYDYDSIPASREPGPFGAVAIAKRNLCTGEVQGLYVPNEYPAEVEFIPNPSGTDEDDGVLIGFVYDGHTDSSFMQVVDAKTMKRLAKAPLPVNVRFQVHASFFPSEGDMTIVV
jgi:carotenoid cleavage dioxygenase-like enzyme